MSGSRKWKDIRRKRNAESEERIKKMVAEMLEEVTISEKGMEDQMFKDGTDFEAIKERMKEIGELQESNEKVTISKEEYDRLKEDSEFLEALHAAGVNNWDGYEIAQEMMGD